MSKLIGWIVAGFGSLIPALVAFFGRKFAVASAVLTAFVVGTAALIVCMKAFAVVVVGYLVLPLWLAKVSWFFPPNMLALFSLIVSGRTCRAAYDMFVEKIKLIGSAS